MPVRQVVYFTFPIVSETICYLIFFYLHNLIPLDATAEFIAGVRGEAEGERGLPCVTVLIGAYSRATGQPIMGVINQPFYNK